MRYLVVNDCHVSDTPPASRTPEYGQQIMAKLYECWDIARASQCDFILISGDLFHKFRGWIVAYRTLIQLLGLFKEAPCPVYAIAGNHDLSYEGVGSIGRMPFGVLAEAGAFHWLSEPLVVGPFAGESALLVPRNWEPYIDHVPTALDLTPKEREMTRLATYTIMIAHAAIFPKGHDPIYAHHKVSNLQTDCIDVLHGAHIHDELGVHELPSGCWFANVGSLARVDASPSSLNRRPAVLLVSLEKGQIDFEIRRLTTALPPSEVFQESPEEIEGLGIEGFADALMLPLEVDETPLDDLISTLTKGKSPEVVQRLRRYLQENDHAETTVRR